MYNFFKYKILPLVISGIIISVFVLIILHILSISLPEGYVIPKKFGDPESQVISSRLMEDTLRPFSAEDRNASEPQQGIGTQRLEPWWAYLAGKLAWPLVILCAMLLIAYNDRLARLFGSGIKIVRKVSAGGVEMEISSDAVDRVKKELQASFQQLIADAKIEYQRMASVQNIDRHLSKIVEEIIYEEFPSLNRTDIRATIHVQDIVFNEFLYQMVNYYPRGGGADRRFSHRYGIIGRSWRSGQSHGTGDAFGGDTSVNTLIEMWGMTTVEASGSALEKHSCLSVILKSGELEWGILYIDSSTKEAFGDNDKALAFAKELEENPKVIKLAEAVERALAPLRAAGPDLDLRGIQL